MTLFTGFDVRCTLIRQRSLIVVAKMDNFDSWHEILIYLLIRVLGEPQTVNLLRNDKNGSYQIRKSSWPISMARWIWIWPSPIRINLTLKTGYKNTNISISQFINSESISSFKGVPRKDKMTSKCIQECKYLL